ncbi:hypothetical protein HCU40_13870 [Pseudanabaena biceps]|nr:hypothetical protein [Pseudanabaena biceps]
MSKVYRGFDYKKTFERLAKPAFQKFSYNQKAVMLGKNAQIGSFLLQKEVYSEPSYYCFKTIEYLGVTKYKIPESVAQAQQVPQALNLVFSYT